MRGFATIVFVACTLTGWGQKYRSSNSEITFFSQAPIEDISATNKKAQSVFDAEKGHLAFSVPIDQFEFRKSMMQEHFNEKYLESDKYPRSTFTAVLRDYVSNQSDTSIVAVGTLEIHGVKRNVEIPGSLVFSEGKVTIHSVFQVTLEDYAIKIPSLMFRNIAEVIEVTINFEYQPL